MRICRIDEVMNEIEMLISMKKHNVISNKYAHSHLLHLMNCLDFLAERFDSVLFSKYLDECIPAITFCDLIQLKQRVSLNRCQLALPV